MISLARVQCAPLKVGTYVGNGGLLEHLPVDQEDGDLIPPPPFRSLGAIRYPLCLCLLEETLNAKLLRWPKTGLLGA